MTWLQLIVLCAASLTGALAFEVNLKAGSDFTILAIPHISDVVVSCDLHTPQEDIINFIPNHKRIHDERFELKEPTPLVGCAVVIKKLDRNDNGVWKLVAKTKGETYTETYEICVLAEDTETAAKDEDVVRYVEVPSLWQPGQAIDLIVGPDDAIFCKVHDPAGHLSFEGFGRCHIKVPKVLKHHSGLWKLLVWRPRKVFPERLSVRVVFPRSDELVSTSVEVNGDSVVLSCIARITKANVNACQFKDHSGREYLVTPETDGSDGYNYYNASDTIGEESGFSRCGLSITHPKAEDVGQWRCSILTEEQTIHGFLTVDPSILKDPSILNDAYGRHMTDPFPVADREVVTVDAGERPLLSCHVMAAIRYCYFTAENGSVYNVWPGSENYVGKGFDAGECGVLLPAARILDSYTWKCHIALEDPALPEMSTALYLTTNTRRMLTRSQRAGQSLYIEARVHSYPLASLEYCRFIRSDGLGFTNRNAPPGYEIVRGTPSQPGCVMKVSKVSSMDLRSWTVVAKLEDQLGELSAVTTNILILDQHLYTWYMTLVLLTMTVTLSVFIVGMLVGPKKNREWTYRQASSVRQSLRRAVQKPADQAPPLPNKESGEEQA